jgi:ElaB/YqjD/DUF883 family membrane-anchored ribosome-binding protein
MDMSKMNASDLAGIPSKVADEVRRTVDSAYDDVSRSVRKARRAAEEVIDDSRREIKRRPIASVGVAALAGLVTGLAIGWWAGYCSKD